MGSRGNWDGEGCRSFSYYGCNLNGNNFLAKEECDAMCGAKIPDREMKLQDTNTDNEKFCKEYEKEHPGIGKMVELTCNEKNPYSQSRLMKVLVKIVKSPKSIKIRKRQNNIDTIVEQIQSLLENGGENLEILNGLIDELENLEREINTVSEEVIPWLLEVGEDIPRRLWWSTVFSTKTPEIKVRIRYHCLKNPIGMFNITDKLFENICNDMIPAGLKRHYERSVSMNGKTRQLTIEPVRVPTFLFAKTFVLAEYCNLGPVGGINPFLYLPTAVWVCEDYLTSYRFKDSIAQIAAHELGHDILWTIPKSLEDGWRWSWFHKNTSSLTQPLL